MPDNSPLILLTNDDGIRSPGLLAAAQAVADLGELLIVAPVTQQTGMGRATPGAIRGPILRQVLQVNGRELPAYAVPGTPAQAVVVALAALAPRRPVLAVAGINYGENIASIVTGSGTVGAALEAAAAGIPALAVSLETIKAYHYEHVEGLNWDTAADVTRRLVQVMLARPMPFDVDILNVNVPESATPETPWRVTRQSRQHYYEFLPGRPGRRPAERTVGLPPGDRLGRHRARLRRTRLCRPHGRDHAIEHRPDLAHGSRGSQHDAARTR